MPGFGVTKGVTSLAGKLVKNKGAKKALTESLGTKLKPGWDDWKNGKKDRLQHEKEGFRQD